jgi:inhibitor of KinA
MRILPLGDEALVVEMGDAIDAPTRRRVHQAWHALQAASLPGVSELVPAYTTVTLYYDPAALLDSGADAGALFDHLEARVRSVLGATEPGAESAVPAARTHDIPVCYGAAFALDLEEVSRRTGLPSAEVIRLHHEAEYEVHLIGFSPGFPYLGGLPGSLQVPRRALPRPTVPAGSVAIAGAQAGIYPQPTPGGWNILGRTPLRLFRPDALPPSLLAPGDRVRFHPISEAEFAAKEREAC